VARALGLDEIRTANAVATKYHREQYDFGPNRTVTEGFRELYAVGNRVDTLRSLIQAKKTDIFAQLQWVIEDVKKVQAEN
jgi:hypothetical protein